MNKIRKGSDEKSSRWYKRSGTIVKPHKNGPIIRFGPVGPLPEIYSDSWKYKPTPGGP
jgi:hypothetical protein